MSIMPAIAINTPAHLHAFRVQAGLRPDWHEPDEQGVGVRLVGDHLDNAMGSQDEPDNVGEYNIVLTVHGMDIAVVNLATLLSWASQHGGDLAAKVEALIARGPGS